MPARIPILDADDAHRLVAPIARGHGEMVAIAYLDPEWRLIGLRHVAGEQGRARPSIRRIVRDALAFDAAALIVAHNHPSGDVTPSAEDIAFTRTCARTLHDIGVALTDHLILAANDWTSFRARGLL